MKLLVVSYKECWATAGRAEFVTVGGFPHQMAALSDLFAETRLMIPERLGDPPPGTTPLTGHRLTVDPLPEPVGSGARRKLALLFWLPRHWRRLWQAVRMSDAVHAPVPGDLGTLGILLALVQRKPLFVRHCGTWGNRDTAADRFLAWLLPRIAGGRNVVLATGGGETPPKGDGVQWIFSTALKRAELEQLEPAEPWKPGQPLRWVQVGRLTAGKNAATTIRALAEIRREFPQVHLDIVGGGPLADDLQQLVRDLSLGDAVTLHGNLAHPDVLALLQKSHLFLFPTRTPEGFPKAVLEALAVGLPFLAPSISVLPHLAAQGGGSVLEDTEPATLAHAVETLIADPERLIEMSHQARRTAQRYSLEDWQDEIRNHLENAWGPLRSSQA